MNEKQVKCPWCKAQMTPKVNRKSQETGAVVERWCSECGKILAAYLESEGNFFSKIRVFENTLTGGNK